MGLSQHHQWWPTRAAKLHITDIHHPLCDWQHVRVWNTVSGDNHWRETANKLPSKLCVANSIIIWTHDIMVLCAGADCCNHFSVGLCPHWIWRKSRDRGMLNVSSFCCRLCTGQWLPSLAAPAHYQSSQWLIRYSPPSPPNPSPCQHPLASSCCNRYPHWRKWWNGLIWTPSVCSLEW